MTNKYRYENTYQEHIQLRGEQCSIINLEQASRELNYLYNIVTYLEDCNNEMFCVILKWIHHHKNKENEKLLEQLQEDLVKAHDEFVDKQYWRCVPGHHSDLE